MIIDDIKKLTGRNPTHRLCARIYNYLDLLHSIYHRKFIETDILILYNLDLEMYYTEENLTYYFHYTDDFEFVTLKILRKERVITKISDFVGSIDQMIKISDVILGII